MKEKKHKNGCNILIMAFTNLEKYVYSKKCLKQRRLQAPPPQPHPPLLSPSKSKVFSRRRSLYNPRKDPDPEMIPSPEISLYVDPEMIPN